MVLCRHVLSTVILLRGAKQILAGNCGLTVSGAEAPDAKFEPLRVGDPDAVDLEDLLFSEPSAHDWGNIRRHCTPGDGDSDSCLTFGIDEWKSSSFQVLIHEGVGGRPCEEDYALVAETCGGQVACQNIEGQIRIVGFAGELGGQTDLTKLSGLPYLSAAVLRGPAKSDFEGHSWPLLRFLRLEAPSRDVVQTVAKALQGPPGRQLRSLQIYGRQDVLRWTPVDLAEFCGLDLVHFTAFVIHVAGGALPECWNKMRNLRNFYCSNCMMSHPPTALRGLQSLRSFVAFRQWEMIPCALQRLSRGGCKASWETRHLFKDGGRATSTGRWEDFQEGPSFLCPQHSFGFAFEEFVKLGWSNIEKVWLDGNFLTGKIPEDIALRWPKLKSLDLYDNDLEGPLPESLGTLPFVKLQLHANNFAGTVPHNVWRLTQRPHLLLGLQENINLTGCTSAKTHWERGVPGTAGAGSPLGGPRAGASHKLSEATSFSCYCK
ncbi:FLS2 [Symbiodinium microadriaticum]|nr:FLS2 [Symbiodinium sp. KB8]CAE7716059.1 FLS2 [Symbiodinium microadriaticum]